GGGREKFFGKAAGEDGRIDPPDRKPAPGGIRGDDARSQAAVANQFPGGPRQGFGDGGGIHPAGRFGPVYLAAVSIAKPAFNRRFHCRDCAVGDGTVLVCPGGAICWSKGDWFISGRNSWPRKGNWNSK